MCGYRLVIDIINVTAIMAMPIPVMMFVVSGSPNIRVPTRIAVIGSNTPKTDALVAPIFLVAMASVAVDTMVGNNASPTRLSQSEQLEMPDTISVWEKAILPRKTNAPTLKA